MNNKQFKILVMKFRNIGDVLLTTPLIENLRYYYPDAVIDFALNKECSAMIEGNPNIRKIHAYDRSIKQQNFFKRLINEIKFIHAIKKEKYDMAIQTTTGDRGIIIAKYAKIKQIVGFEGKNKALNLLITHKTKRPKIGYSFQHIIEQNLNTLRTLGYEPISKKVSIYANENLISSIDLPNFFVHFHLTSRWMFKCANDETMAELIDFCERDLDVRVVITGDKNEAEIKKIDDVLAICHSKPLNLAGKLNLKQVAALSEKSSLFVGVDTAVMHIAAANDVSVIAFFGASGAFEWGPWDNSQNESGYRAKNGIQTMGRNIVFQKDWDFVPCDKDGITKNGVEKTLMNFSDELPKIKEKIRQNLKGKI